jgi:ABC-type multidrug transport system ATPase subunit
VNEAPVLLAESIGKSFGVRRILSSARIAANAASITLLAGRNGSGKSTLFRIVGGLLAPDSGIVRFAGEIFQRPRLHRLAELGLFYLPDRDLLAPSIPLRSQLASIANRFHSGDVEIAAERLGITDLLDALPREFSGGELRRSEVAAAFVRRPICIIADEPLRGIDPQDTAAILGGFTLLAKSGCAIILSGHDVTPLLDVADTVVWLTAGTTYSLGNPAAAVANEHFRKNYLTGRWD